MVGGSDWWVGGLVVAYREGTNQGAELAEISGVCKVQLERGPPFAKGAATNLFILNCEFRFRKSLSFNLYSGV